MVARFSCGYQALGAVLVAAIAGQAACGSAGKAGGSTGFGGSPGAGGASSGAGGSRSAGTAGSVGSLVGSTGSLGTGGASMQGLYVEPSSLQTITVQAGKAAPTVAYTATFDGAPVKAGWGVDRGDLGTIPAGPSASATFTPSGTTGGLVTVRAGLNKQTVTRQILVKLTAAQNGATPGNPLEQAQIPASVAALSAAGGVGGVGGEGLGGPVASNALLNALGNPAGNGQAQKLGFLYPYDKTVFPRGTLAPLLMWSWVTGDADAIQLELKTTSGSFSWKGTFGRPAILAQTGGAFIRHPIPQDIWDMATDTAGAPMLNAGVDKLTVSLTIAKGTTAYGPITETWVVAPARLTGTVYYNSYGTQLVKNWVSPDQAGNPVGAAILGVRSGDTGPTLIVGQDSPLDGNGHPTDDSGCRVCHVVSSRGHWLISQSEQGTPGDGRSFLYDLTSMNVLGSAAQLPQEGVFAWAAMVSDGSHALTNSIDPSSSNPAILNSHGNGATSSFWKFGAAPVSAPTTGLPSPVAAGYPAYSPDDKLVAYVDVTNQTGNVDGPLVVASYDAANQTFSNVRNILSPMPGQRIGYPVFLPDDSGVVFETEVRSSQGDSVMVTRNGARSELWWTTLGASPKATPLASLNGKGYLPIGANNHGIPGATDPQSQYDETGYDDTTLNYEPTVLPIVAGGYAWVVLTSRRMYGNQLDAVPWQSWPPSYDTRDLAQGTVKKLWVAAIDLNAPAGSDPSHPAFYLPAQEILAGNSRGFLVLDPCKPDGLTCATGDQCCNGYCEPSGDGGLVCQNTPPNGHCSAPQEKCKTAADCCDPTDLCVNGFCAQPGPQ